MAEYCRECGVKLKPGQYFLCDERERVNQIIAKRIRAVVEAKPVKPQTVKRTTGR
jgi:hypothetical protein